MTKINFLLLTGLWLLLANHTQAQNEFWKRSTEGLLTPTTFSDEVKMDLATVNDARIGALQVNQNANIAGSIGLGGAPDSRYQAIIYGDIRVQSGEVIAILQSDEVTDEVFFSRIGGGNRLSLFKDRVETARLRVTSSVALGTNNWELTSRGTNAFQILYDNTKLLNLTTDGRLGIGTSYVPENFKMAIEGNLVVEEMLVDLREDWPDYVFEEDYDLMPLINLQTYIQTHGHLPNIPSAQEVQTEGGIYVGAINTKLLEKIEELTLYTLAQEEKLSAQQQQYEQLVAEMAALKAMVETLKEEK
ncbi:MAG: hypothetical protein AAF734_03590 [Bacteroidota bacterium]